jgi:uncharacterized membrane protein
MIETLLILCIVILLVLIITARSRINHLTNTQHEVVVAVDEFLKAATVNQQLMQDVLEEHRLAINNHREILLSLVSLEKSDDKGDRK